MFQFDRNAQIDVEGIQNIQEQYFFMLCMGLVQYHLDLLPDDNPYKGEFEVKYYMGGTGGDGFEIVSKKYPQTGFIWGLAEGTLGGCCYLDGLNGLTGEFSNGMDNTVFTLDELNGYLFGTIRELLVDNKIEEVMDEKKRVKTYEEWGVEIP